MGSFDPAGGRTWTLPPLILHPFTDASGPDKLTESSRASLILQGLLPGDEFTLEDLNRRVLDGRYHEIRMLCYVGKDLLRWIDQCLEFARRDEQLRDTGLRIESFAGLLVDEPPEAVRKKLQAWGVVDHRSIFARALGLAAVFVRPPDRDMLADDFIRNHYRYADQLFECRKRMFQHPEIRGANFHFDLYASGEYARMLEREWEGR